MKFIPFLILLASISLGAQAQLHDHDHHHDHDHFHMESKLGIGVAPTLVYLPGEKEFAPGFHIHALKLFNQKLGAGIGYEVILEEHPHQTFTVFGKYFITDFLSINAGPGITLPTEEHNEYSLSGHIELATAFDIWQIHIGPMIGYGFGAEDSHVSIGIHMGWHF